MTTDHDHRRDQEPSAEEPAVQPSRLDPVDDLARLLEGTSLLVVPDADQVRDHSGKPVPPTTKQGRPYRWKIRLRGANLYASTADEVLAAFIADHHPDPHRDGWDGNREFDQARLRGLHLLGLMTTHVTAAVLDGSLNSEKLDLMARTVPVGRPPLTEDDIVYWDVPDVPLLLMADLYDDTMVPPGGHVLMIRTGGAQQYLLDLARAGFVSLQENPIYDSRSVLTMETASAEGR